MTKNNYFKSEDIKVYPCAYRGNTGGADIDLYSRVPVEYNTTRARSAFQYNNDVITNTYIADIELGSDNVISKLCCVIDGYYFIINNMESYDDKLKLDSDRFLCINTVALDKGNTQTKVLTSFAGTELDVKEGNDYYFTGLLRAKGGTPQNATASLPLTTAFKYPISYKNIVSADNKTCILGDLVKDGDNNIYRVKAENNVSGNNNLLLGYGLDANNSTHATYLGQYNTNPVDNNAKLIVGNGSESSRSNLLEVGRGRTILHSNSFKLNKNADDTISVGVTLDANGSITVTGDGDSGGGASTTITGDKINTKKITANGVLLDNNGSLLSADELTLQTKSESTDWFQVKLKNARSSAKLLACDSIKIFNGSDNDQQSMLIRSRFTNETGEQPSAETTWYGNSEQNKTTVSSSGITTVGEVQAVSFYATSDARKKENVESYKCDKSILDLDVKKFDFIDGDKNQIGCIAQDLREICPEIVREDADGYLSIQENKIIYLLLNEVKELKKEIEELKRGE